MSENAAPTDAPVACPSSHVDHPKARLFAVVTGSVDEPFLAYLPTPEPVTPALLAQLDGVRAAEVVRVTAPCAAGGCREFIDGACQVARRVLLRAPAADALPACSIRRECRWYRDHGGAACLRCPEVVTYRAASARRHLPVV